MLKNLKASVWKEYSRLAKQLVAAGWHAFGWLCWRGLALCFARGQVRLVYSHVAALQWAYNSFLSYSTDRGMHHKACTWHRCKQLCCIVDLGHCTCLVPCHHLYLPHAHYLCPIISHITGGEVWMWLGKCTAKSMRRSISHTFHARKCCVLLLSVSVLWQSTMCTHV